MLGASREGFEAYEQLAIHYERRTRDPLRAAELAREALAELRRANRLGMIAANTYRQTSARFEQRLARLKLKTECRLLGAMQGESGLEADQSASFSSGPRQQRIRL